MTDTKRRGGQIDWLRRHLRRLEDFGLTVREASAEEHETHLGASRYNQNEGTVEIEAGALAPVAGQTPSFPEAQHSAYRIIGGYLLCGPEDEATAGGRGHPRRGRTGNAPPCLAQADGRGRHPALQYVLRRFAERRMARAHGPNWHDEQPGAGTGVLAPGAGRNALPWLPNADVEDAATRLVRDLEGSLGDDLQEGPWGPLGSDPPTWDRWLIRDEWIRTRTEEDGLRCRRRSAITGRYKERVLAMRTSQLEAWLRGQAIQVAIPQLAPEEREFLLTGVTAEEWARGTGSAAAR